MPLNDTSIVSESSTYDLAITQSDSSRSRKRLHSSLSGREDLEDCSECLEGVEVVALVYKADALAHLCHVDEALACINK